MSVAAIFNIPDTPESLSQWAFDHMAHHRDILRVILENDNVPLPEFVLDPFDPTDFRNVWFYQHQVMHNNQNAVLGIAGNNLLDVDWNDREALEDWILLNANEHLQASDKLEIG